MIETLGLTRRNGDRLAVDPVHFAVTHDETFGFPDPNGAGRRTTVRLLAAERRDAAPGWSCRDA